MPRPPLATAFVTTAITAGCAWSYGGGVQHVWASEGAAATNAYGRVAFGLGDGRSALTITNELGFGYNASSGGLWVHGANRLQWSSLPLARSLGWRVGAGGLYGGARGAHDFVAGPSLAFEALYGLNVNGPDGPNGYAATLIGLGLTASYDVADEATGPVYSVSLSISREGILPFGNPPRPQLAAPPRAPPSAPPRSPNVQAVDPGAPVR